MLVLGVLVSSCELPDNIDPKSATTVPEEVLLTNALRDGLSLIDNMNQNVNVGRFLCQYSSQVQYTDPSRYNSLTARFLMDTGILLPCIA